MNITPEQMAAMQAQQAQQAQQAPQGAYMEEMPVPPEEDRSEEIVMEIATLLLQGVTEEELIASGIPEEVVVAVKQMLEEQMEAEQSGISPAEMNGLAGAAMQQAPQ